MKNEKTILRKNNTFFSFIQKLNKIKSFKKKKEKKKLVNVNVYKKLVSCMYSLIVYSRK